MSTRVNDALLRIFAASLAAAAPSPSFAAPTVIADIVVSSAPASKSAPITFTMDSNLGTGGKSRSSVGVKGGLSEGKPLEVMVWGSGGAVAGSLAGPLGTIIGAGAGALCGLLYSILIVPHNGPGEKRR